MVTKDLNILTADSLFGGDLVCYQNKYGYRYSIDAVLLAHFSLGWRKATILDMGCGCGILGLILLYRNGENIVAVDGIELQPGLTAIAGKNILANNLDSKLTIKLGDYRKISNSYSSEIYSHVICNPPFYRIGSGRRNENEESYLARHQSCASTFDVATAASYVLKNKGVISLIFPAESIAEITHALQCNRIQPKRIRPVYSYPEAPNATLVLIEGVKNGGIGANMMKPLYIYKNKNGSYSDEVESMYLQNATRAD